MTPAEITAAITQSQNLENDALTANNGGRPNEAKKLYNEAGNALMPVMEFLSDPSVKGEQAVRLVNLKLRGGKLKKAIAIAQQHVSQNSIPDISRATLTGLIQEITARQTEIQMQQRNRNGGGAMFNNTHAVNFFAPIAGRILALPSDHLQTNLALALQASILIDTDNAPPQPYSPARIAQDFGLPIAVQRQYNICLTKDTALEFMNQLGIALTQDKVRRQFTEKKYQKLFDRPISTDGKRPYVFTYAEVLHMQELATMLPFPTGLGHLL